MKIALYGTSGMIGRCICEEALVRGHQITGIARDPAKLDLRHPRLTTAKGDVRDPASIASAVAGHDAVISAVGPRQDDDPQMVVEAANALTQGLQRAGVRRLLVVGGAGSLEIEPGLQLVDTPDFPAAWKPVSLAARDALAVYRAADLDWTYLSPAAEIAPGERTGQYRTDTDRLVTDAAGESHISAEDYAVAMLDELEQPKHIRQRFTAAY